LLFGKFGGQSVPHTVPERVPWPFHRVQFRAVGWEREDPHVVGQVGMSVGKIKGGSVPDENMDGVRVTVSDLQVKMSQVYLVHRLGRQELAPD